MAGDDRESGWTWGGPQDGQPDVPPTPPGPTQQPQYGQYGQQPQQSQYGQYGAPTSWGSGGAQYMAAAQPGIVPLRPLNLGEMLDGAFKAIRANPKVMFGLSLIVMSVVALIEGVLMYFVLDSTTQLVSGEMTEEAMAAFGASTLSSALLVSLASGFATIILTGLLILSVSQSVLGRVVTLAALWQQARGQIWRLVGQTIVVGFLTTAAILLALVGTLMLVGLAVAGAGDSVGAWVIFPILVMLVLGLVAGAWLGVRLSLAPPTLMLERARIWPSIRRSWSLTQGHFWRIFGILAVSLVIVLAASAALQVPVSVFAAFAFQGGDTIALGPLLLTNVVSVLISAVTVPFYAAVLALVYVDVRMRKEGLDVELARAAEAG